MSVSKDFIKYLNDTKVKESRIMNFVSFNESKYSFEDFTHSDMEMVKELYEEGLTDPKQISIEMDLPVETIIQIIDTLKRRNEINEGMFDRFFSGVNKNEPNKNTKKNKNEIAVNIKSQQDLDKARTILKKYGEDIDESSFDLHDTNFFNYLQYLNTYKSWGCYDNAPREGKSREIISLDELDSLLSNEGI